MKKAPLIPALFCFAPFAFAFSADARPGGCLKGAIVDGMHRLKTYDRENGYDGRSGYEQRGGKASTGAIE